MSYADFVPVISLSVVLGALLISLHVGALGRDAFWVAMTRLFIDKGQYWPHEIYSKSDLGLSIKWSGWILRVFLWIGTFLVLMWIAEMVLGTNPLTSIDVNLGSAVGARDGATLAGIICIILVTNLMTLGDPTSTKRERSPTGQPSSTTT